MTVTAHVLQEPGDQVRALARRRMVQRQVGPEGRWTPLEPDLVALADQFAEWAGHTPREDPATSTPALQAGALRRPVTSRRSTRASRVS